MIDLSLAQYSRVLIGLPLLSEHLGFGSGRPSQTSLPLIVP